MLGLIGISAAQIVSKLGAWVGALDFSSAESVELPADTTVGGSPVGGAPVRIYHFTVPTVPGGAPYPRARVIENGTVTAIRVNIDGAAESAGTYTLGIYNYPGWKNLLNVSSIDLKNAGLYADFVMATLALSSTPGNLTVVAGDTLQVQTESNNADLIGARTVSVQIEVTPD